MADEIVPPGEQITPQVDLDGAVKLAEQLYGIRVDIAKELNGYDDKNFHLKVSESPSNIFMSQLWPHGYVLKIMNSSDSKKLDYVEAQCAMMLHLDKHGIATPQPQRTSNGNFYCLEQLPNGNKKDAEISTEHVVRLLSFQDGTLMKDIPGSLTLYNEVGRCAAQVDLVLKSFSHPAYNQYSSRWMLKHVSHVKEYLFAVNDDKKTSLVNCVIEEFEKNVLLNFSSLKLGMIHGDIHDQNLLCKQDSVGEWHISAVLDLGDAHYSAYVIELALTMTYIMLHSEDVQSGSYVIAGYCSLHPLPLQELKLLKVCVCARLCQSLVLGLYTYSLCPDNQYVLSTQAPGWKLLHTLWAMDSAQLDDIWLKK